MDSRLYWPPHEPGEIARHHGLLRHHDGTYWECWCDDCNSWRRKTWWTRRSEASIQAEIAYERAGQRRALRYCLTHRDAYLAAAIDGPSHLCRYKRVFIVTPPLRKRLQWAAQRLWRWLSTLNKEPVDA